ncbi:MAG: DUF2490 domain-containing protein [Marinilabiliaceae bacterium]|nr:DUF2490 domain-containing protein [Marinilabiliaceae bacterium]
MIKFNNKVIVEMKFWCVMVIITIFFQSANAQEHDFRGWYSVTVDYEFFDLIDCSVSPQLRFMENHAELDSWLIDADVSYKASDWFRVGALYRYQMETDHGILEDRIHRFGVMGKFSYRIKPFDIYYRTQYQYEYKNMYSSKNGLIPEKVWRHKIQAKFDKKKIDFKPFVSFEYFRTMFPPVDIGKQKIRIKAGSEYKINKQYSVSLSYVFQKGIMEPDPALAHTIAIDINFDFK